MELAEGEAIDTTRLTWLVAMHLTFVVSGLLLAIMDWVAGKTGKAAARTLS